MYLCNNNDCMQNVLAHTSLNAALRYEIFSCWLAFQEKRWLKRFMVICLPTRHACANGRKFALFCASFSAFYSSVKQFCKFRKMYLFSALLHWFSVYLFSQLTDNSTKLKEPSTEINWIYLITIHKYYLRPSSLLSSE